MEKEEIKKALSTCFGCHPCKNCKYENGYLNFPTCAVDLMKDALALIEELEKTEFVCPVCQGRGYMPGNFYEIPGVSVSIGEYADLAYTQSVCRRCNGQGTIKNNP